MQLAMTGRIALITGASSGFGAHFARLFVREGAVLAIGTVDNTAEYEYQDHFELVSFGALPGTPVTIHSPTGGRAAGRAPITVHWQ